MSYRTRDQQTADEAMDGYRPCMFCKRATLVETLSQYGARCLACYEHYLDEVPSKPLYTLAEKKVLLQKVREMSAFKTSDPHAWARSLKAREESGERLSVTQRTMWRMALKVPA